MIERTIERLLFLSRWLMLPFFFGLVIALGMLAASFIGEIVNAAPQTLRMSDTEIILFTLSILDLTLAGSLVLMVMLAGYESFVSRLDISTEDRPSWLGRLGFSGLKLRLIASIIAISSIHLLKFFMNIPENDVDHADLLWLVVIHLSFVLTGILLAAMEYIGSRTPES